jgi:hypothetical protein
VRVGLDDLPGHRVDQPAVAVEDRDDDRVAAGGALAFLPDWLSLAFEARRAVAAVEPEASPRRAGRRAQDPAHAATLVTRSRRRRRRVPARARHRRRPRADRGALGDRHAQRRQALGATHELPGLRFLRRQGGATHVALKDDHPRVIVNDGREFTTAATISHENP